MMVRLIDNPIPNPPCLVVWKGSKIRSNSAAATPVPLVITPYGIGALIALLAASRDAMRMELIFGLLLGVMTLNLLAMVLAWSRSAWSA